MLLPFLKAKIHRATVTGAKKDYVGSVTIDPILLEAADILPGQYVRVNNVNNGTPWQTYAVEGTRGAGEIILNGPPAHFFKKGHIVIILAECILTPKEIPRHNPTIVFVDKKNKITSIHRMKDIPINATGAPKNPKGMKRR